ncbi:UvrD-helicase domain-containing protein [Candidatus Kapabacteria bacterium]|nr:UvrD-helicase domain-containing protein [Candidatus Kapabacteria bacterium]
MSLILKPEEKLQSWQGKLNPNQLEAVKHKDGPLLIIAGAGSGKTRVLTSRIGSLIESGVEPWKILTLTFTNKAAKEMKERIGGIVYQSQADKVWAGTFHSVFARILRIEAESLGYTPNFSIYDSDDQLSAIKTVMDSLNISKQQYSPNAIRSKISGSKNQMISWQEFKEKSDRPFDKHAANIFRDYESLLKRNNAMDFDDLLLNILKLFKLSKEILSTYQDKFKYVLVDEYQDTNRAQYLILKQLAAKHNNICVVGDDAQSIYKWRGADIQNILDFQKDYPYAKVVKLEQNYRSTKNILGAADSVIKNNRNQLPKTLWTEKEDGDKIEVFQLEDDRAEATKITDKISSLKKDFSSLNDFAILYRTNAQSLALENSLRSKSIPYVVVGGLSFFKRKEVKDVLAYLKLLVNPSDGESLKRIINEPPRGIGKTSLQHIENFAYSRNINLFESFENSNQNQNLQKRAIVASKKFTSIVSQYVEKLKDENEFYILKDYIDEVGLLDMYEEIGTEESEDRANNIRQLLTDISIFFKENDDVNLNDYLSQTALASDYDEKDISSDKVTLMTLHSSKGLEFPVVFIAGLEQGLFPLSRSEYDRDEEEEERRLFYVGITRAENKLILSLAKRRMKFGEISYQMPSNFLSEIDSKYLNYPNRPNKPIVNTAVPRGLFDSPSSKSKSLKDKYSGQDSTTEFSQIPDFEENYSQVSDDHNRFKVGDIVSHSQFGEGTISGLKGEGDRKQAVVRFKSVGRKMLMLKYAKLRLIKSKDDF